MKVREKQLKFEQNLTFTQYRYIELCICVRIAPGNGEKQFISMNA